MTRWSVSSILDAKGDRVEVVEPNAPVIEAIRRMNGRRIGCVIVANGNEIVGIFSERDALVRVLMAGRDPALTTVAAVMTRDLVCIAPDTSIEHAMHIATETHCRHLPVVDGDRLCGLISTGDLIKWVVRDQRLQIDDLIRFITS